LASSVKSSEINSKELLANEINGIINFDKFRSQIYDDLCFGVTFWGHRVDPITETYSAAGACVMLEISSVMLLLRCVKTLD